jgi:hypothetical protein
MPQRLDHRPFDLHPDSIEGVSREKISLVLVNRARPD